MKKIYILLSLSLISLTGRSQIISTIAGNGVASYTGDGGQATLAGLNNPSGIAFDNSSGNMYIADASNHVVRMVTPAGVITTIAGTGTAGYTGDGGAPSSATLNSPTALAIDNNSNIYICDAGNNVVRKISGAGIISTYAGNGTPGNTGDGGLATAAQLYDPIGIVYDYYNSVIFICDDQNHNVRQVNASGIISTVAGTGTAGYSGDGGPATSAQLHFPSGITVDFSGNLFIADRINYCIRFVNTSTGNISTFAGVQSSGCGYSGDGGLATSATLCNPSGVYYNTFSELYITDSGNSNVRKVNTSNIISTVTGFSGIGIVSGYSGDGGLATYAQLNNPVQFTFDMADNGYIVDQGNNVIRRICNKTDSLYGLVKDQIGTPVYPGSVYLFRQKPSH